MRRAAFGAAVMAAFAACGPAIAPSIGTSQRAPADAGADAADAAVDAAEAWPSLASIATRAAPSARGMREVARAEIAGDGGAKLSAEIARAEGRDVCVRVAYAAPAPVVARIEDGANMLTERAGESEGLLGARGPVCVTRGGALRVTFEGAAKIRFVAWVAP